jgi:hypothetical protein
MGYLLKKTPQIARSLMSKINTNVKLELMEKNDLLALKGSISDALNEIAQIIEKQRADFGKPNFKTLMSAQGPINHLANEFHESAKYLFSCKDAELQAAGKIIESLGSELYKFKGLLVPVSKPQSDFHSADEALAYFSDKIVKPFRTQFLPLINLEERQVDYELSTHLKSRPGYV